MFTDPGSQEWILAGPAGWKLQREDSLLDWPWIMAVQSHAIYYMPCNGLATFERLMEQALAGLPLSTALVYLDNILVPGQSFSHQLTNLLKVFEGLRAAKLKLSPKKCLLYRREVKYLGHVVTVRMVYLWILTKWMLSCPGLPPHLLRK